MRYTIMMVFVILLSSIIAAAVILSAISLSENAFGGLQSNDGVAIAASGDNVYLTWPSNKTGNWEVLFRASNDSGKSFSDKINLSNSTNGDSTFNNGIVTSGDNAVHVAWNDNKTGNTETYVRTSTDAGKTFSEAVMVNGTGTGSQGLILLTSTSDLLEDALDATELAASGNNIYVLSWDNKTGNWEVFLGKSHDGGKTFETINLSNSTDTRSNDAHVVSEGDNVYVTWWETSNNGTRTPFFVSSDDNGETFGSPLRVADNGPIGNTIR